MMTASKLAGFFAAHAVWCVSEGGTLTPMLAYTTVNDERRMERLAVAGDLEASVLHGRRRLASNEMGAVDAVLLYDGRITIGGEKLDAIVVEVRAHFLPGAEATVAVPYTPKASGRFRVHRPKLLAWEGCEDFDTIDALASFLEGVAEHEQGAKVWDAALDESR